MRSVPPRGNGEYEVSTTTR